MNLETSQIPSPNIYIEMVHDTTYLVGLYPENLDWFHKNFQQQMYINFFFLKKSLSQGIQI